MFVYVLRFCGIGRPRAVVKIGQTGEYKRAIGKVGFSQEKARYGAPESILLAVSRRRLEDEAALLRLARERLGRPFRGYEWFLGTPAETSDFVVGAQTLLADRGAGAPPNTQTNAPSPQAGPSAVPSGPIVADFIRRIRSLAKSGDLDHGKLDRFLAKMERAREEKEEEREYQAAKREFRRLQQKKREREREKGEGETH